MPNDHDPMPELEHFVRRGQAGQAAVDAEIARFSEEAALLARVAEELETMATPAQLDMQPASALAMAGLIQLALRHPGLSSTLRGTASLFLGHMREYFADRPAVLELLAKGDDPAHDVRPDGLTISERQALASIVGEYVRTPHHSEEFIDVVRDVVTTPQQLLARLLDVRT